MAEYHCHALQDSLGLQGFQELLDTLEDDILPGTGLPESCFTDIGREAANVAGLIKTYICKV